jgi:hypothetical protein
MFLLEYSVLRSYPLVDVILWILPAQWNSLVHFLDLRAI